MNQARKFVVLKKDYEHISSLMLKNVYQGIPIEIKSGDYLNLNGAPVKSNGALVPTLLEVANIHVSNFEKMVEKGIRSPHTLRQWKATTKKIEEFWQEKKE